MAAGTTDGPGDFDFTQGSNGTNPNPFWNWLASFLSDPTEEEVACQYPKPILLNTGDMAYPCPWTGYIMPLQMIQIGQFYIIAVPGEFTTMSGRRLRDTVRQTLLANGAPSDLIVVIAGVANEYSHYITTYQEYAYQRYEGASTLYGPHTLAAYQQEYSKLAAALATGSTVDPGPTPGNYANTTREFLPPVIFDEVPLGIAFGDVLTQPKSTYQRGNLVSAVFYGASPRNDFRIQDTFLTVELETAPPPNATWKVVLTDGDYETKYFWQRLGIAESLITIYWQTSENTPPGTYRINHFGNSRDLEGDITPYQGTTQKFTVQ
jgi:neutral ceramidase